MKFTPAPDPGSNRLDLNDVLGELLAVEVLGYEPEIQTERFGVSDAVRVDCHVITGELAPRTYDDQLWFGRVLIGTLRDQVGGPAVVGRLGKGVARKGRSAPWVLYRPSAADLLLAESELNDGDDAA